MSSKRKDAEARTHPWRDNIEAVTVSIIIIVLFKYFILEAYKIPTGSMQPTLMGWTNRVGRGGVFDRVLVDKLSYHYRDPERWEIVVFKYPLDHSKNFIKRIVGMPDEYLDIQNGDLFHASREGEPLTILRRSRPVQREMLKTLDSAGQWRVLAGGWSADGRSIVGQGPGRATYPAHSDGVRDRYFDGYPGKMGERIKAERSDGSNRVGDLRLTALVAARADCTEVRLEFREGPRTYALRYPGPAAPVDARPSITVTDAVGTSEGMTVSASEPWRLRAGRKVRLGGQNLDDLVQLEVGGEILAQVEVPAAVRLRSSLELVANGGGASFTDVTVERDVYYTEPRRGDSTTSWNIPPGHYVMLGDNTQDSSDGREWTFKVYELYEGDGPRIVKGNDRSGDNPFRVRTRRGTTTLYFRDELGERWIFRQDRARELRSQLAPFVPRELIRGRAVLVVWPMVPSLDVYRLQWVH